MHWLAYIGLVASAALFWGTVFGLLGVYPPMDLYVARTATALASVAIAWKMLTGRWVI